MVVTLGQWYNVGEKPTVIMYTYINRHAGPPNKRGGLVIVYDNSMYVYMYVWSSHIAEYGSTG